MIPPLSERRLRPCETCHCYWEATCAHDGVGCSINAETRTIGEPENKYGWKDRNNMFRDNHDMIPCEYHLTKEEYMESVLK